ncbi:hypothetical protein [Chitinophaga nivalis]|uniref:Uncharacterized protein n=1 Tax=Chitinophaga nivalis TaxID=2991709 RepID=A0ABT3IPK8_9BACT|nr:hypothetical protein [Chitinophaga nivalis]MCW3464436.1 hypothetical protein [Chitinophaga nivalis]MCW3485873.1 hypothetical protein [Chitinophaga nivalis]
MQTGIYPNERKPETEEQEKTSSEDAIIHDGSGGAFEGTETVSEEREDKPRPGKPRPAY